MMPQLDVFARRDEPVTLVVPGERGECALAYEAPGLYPPVVETLK